MERVSRLIEDPAGGRKDRMEQTALCSPAARLAVVCTEGRGNVLRELVARLAAVLLVGAESRDSGA